MLGVNSMPSNYHDARIRILSNRELAH